MIVPFLIGVLVGGLLVGGGDDGDRLSPELGRAFSPVGEPLAGELAARFRPWLRFDSKERWRPISIESLLAERLPGSRPAHEFCARSSTGTRCRPVGDLDALEAALSKAGAQGGTTYIDIAGKRVKEYRTTNGRCLEGHLQDCDDTSASAIYYRVTSSNGRFYVDYWWFMRYNHFAGTSATCVVPTELCGEHEGDWEGVTMVTSAADPETLDYVAYAAHTGSFRYPADQLQIRAERPGLEERPEVFVARGSHAAYPKRCSKLICTQPIAIAGLIDTPEASTNGGSEWGRNDDSCDPEAPGSCLLPLPDAETGLTNWVTWAGLWGATCGTRCQSEGSQAPESPGRQTRFQYPWCSTQEGAPICDTAAPGCSDWIGPVVAVLACNPQALARGLQEDLPAGGLTMLVTTADGKRLRVSATTTGVVQALGEPLAPGSKVELTGVGAANEIHLRAQRGLNLLEARFEPFAGTSPEDEVTIWVDARGGEPTVFATVEGGAKPIRPQVRRVLLEVGQ